MIIKSFHRRYKAFYVSVLEKHFSHFHFLSTLGGRKFCCSRVNLFFSPEGGMEGQEREKDSSPKRKKGTRYVRLTPQTLPCSSSRRTSRSHLGFISCWWEKCVPHSREEAIQVWMASTSWGFTLYPWSLDFTVSTACNFLHLLSSLSWGCIWGFFKKQL